MMGAPVKWILKYWSNVQVKFHKLISTSYSLFLLFQHLNRRLYLSVMNLSSAALHLDAPLNEFMLHGIHEKLF